MRNLNWEAGGVAARVEYVAVMEAESGTQSRRQNEQDEDGGGGSTALYENAPGRRGANVPSPARFALSAYKSVTGSSITYCGGRGWGVYPPWPSC